MSEAYGGILSAADWWSGRWNLELFAG